MAAAAVVSPSNVVQEATTKISQILFESDAVTGAPPHDSVVVIGETGCGKTTKVPLSLLLADPRRRIAVTQPRRIAATTVATYVAKLSGSQLGDLVGYKIRNEDVTHGRIGKASASTAVPAAGGAGDATGMGSVHASSEIFEDRSPDVAADVPLAQAAYNKKKPPTQQNGNFGGASEKMRPGKTKLIFMTDGILLQQLVSEPLLPMYDVVVIDEAHERSINIDLVLGLLKRSQALRLEYLRNHAHAVARRHGKVNAPLKVIVMSATIDHKSFSKFFHDCPIVELPSRKYPVTIRYDVDVMKHMMGQVGSQRYHGVATAATPCVLSSWEEEENFNARSAGAAAMFPPLNRHDLLRLTEEHGIRHLQHVWGEGGQDPTDSVQLGLAKAKEEMAARAALCVEHYLVGLAREGAPVTAPVSTTDEQPHHDILIFVSGEDEISIVEKKLQLYRSLITTHNLVVMKMHSAVPSDVMDAAIRRLPPDASGRPRIKVIIATNIAETSITIDGIGCVIDSGRIKLSDFDVKTGVGALVVQLHNKSGCNQRTGRAGRICAGGVCYRLFSRETFKLRKEYITPEILRSDLSHVLLQMKIAGLHNPTCIPLLASPPQASWAEALQVLMDIGALSESRADSAERNMEPEECAPPPTPADANDNDDRSGGDDDADASAAAPGPDATKVRTTGYITEKGFLLSKLTFRPDLGNLVIEAMKFHCLEQALIIGALVNAGKPIFQYHPDIAEAADLKHAKFAAKSRRSDFLKAFEAYCDWYEQGASRYNFAKNHFLSTMQLQEVAAEVDRLKNVLRQCGINVEEYTDWSTRYGPRGWTLPTVGVPSSEDWATDDDVDVLATPISRCISAAFAHCMHVSSSGTKAGQYRSYQPIHPKNTNTATKSKRPNVALHPASTASCVWGVKMERLLMHSILSVEGAHQPAQFVDDLGGRLQNTQPPLMITMGVMKTTNVFARWCHPVLEETLLEVAPKLMQRVWEAHHADPASDEKQEEGTGKENQEASVQGDDATGAGECDAPTGDPPANDDDAAAIPGAATAKTMQSPLSPQQRFFAKLDSDKLLHLSKKEEKKMNALVNQQQQAKKAAKLLEQQKKAEEVMPPSSSTSAEEAGESEASPTTCEANDEAATAASEATAASPSDEMAQGAAPRADSAEVIDKDPLESAC